MTSSPDPRQPPSRVGPDDPAARAIAEAFSTAVARLAAARARARSGDPKGIRRLRTASRRLRSQLRAFRKLIDPEWGDRLVAELRWIGSTLGETRDLDVLRDRLANGESDTDREALRPLFDSLAERRGQAVKAVGRMLRGRRFRDLMAELERSAAAPATIPKAGKPCRKVLPPLVARAWRRLRRESRGLTSASPDQAFHDLRIVAKRARYVTELIAPTLGPRAQNRGTRLVALARGVQDVLGAHQDAVVAASAVAASLAQADSDDAYHRAAVALLSRLRRAADDARDDFLDRQLPELRRRKNRGELKSGG